MEDKIKGLNEEEVLERIDTGLINEADIKTDKSVKEIVVSNVFTYFNFIFIILAILITIAGSFRNLTFMVAVICNTAIGIFQELRAKKTLDEMNLLNMPSVSVIRNEKLEEISINKLVKDDVILLKSGDQIPADGVILTGELYVNESLLTGEQDSIKKVVDDNLLSGSYVVSGSAYIKLTSVGKDAYISKLALKAKTMGQGEQSEMIKSINQIVKWVGIIIVPIGILLFYQAHFVNGETFSKSIVTMVAAVIGMIPEGLYLLTTMALTLSTINLSRDKVLLHDMKSIEALARVDVLCVDKTGTITDSRMCVSDIIPYKNGNKEELKELLKEYSLAISDNNSTMLAIREYLKDVDSDNFNVIKTMPFSSDKKYGLVSFKEGNYLLGAPEFILKEDYDLYKKDIEKYLEGGSRVLFLAECEKYSEENIPINEISPLAYIILDNAIRDNAKETFAYFKKQGVDIKVISGDNPLTVSRVSYKAGIENSDKYVDMTTIKDEDIKDVVNEYTVFGRVTPIQKQKLIRALKEKGHTVAMTGDGVNDILAMKDADCSIAMASGSEATCQAAQTVLLDSDFSHMPSVVYEGRRVVNNIQRSASLFLVKNIFSLFMAIFSLSLTITYPLEPNQISLIAGFTIGIPGFLLALEPNKERIKGKFIENVLIKALPAGITDALAVGIFVICGEVFSISSGQVSTVSTMILAAVGFMIMIYISKPFNRMKYFILIINVVGLILSVIFLKGYFSLVKISGVCFLLMIVFVFASITSYHYLNAIAIFVDKRVNMIRNNKEKWSIKSLIKKKFIH